MKICAKRLLQTPFIQCMQLMLCLALGLSFTTPAFAQLSLRGPIPAAAPGRAEAPIDLTGTWVSVVTEDWAYRMLTPAIGDTMSVPVNEAAIAVTNNWDLEADNANGMQCRAFGAARIMRVPTRLQISWEDDYTLRIDTDAGSQSRLLKFLFRQVRRPLLKYVAAGSKSGKDPGRATALADWENIMLGRGQQLVQGFNRTERAPPAGGAFESYYFSNAARLFKA